MRIYVASFLFALTAAVLWGWIQNHFTPQNLVVGFLWGIGILLLWRQRFLREPWTQASWRRAVWGVWCIGILLRAILLSNIFVLQRVIRPRLALRPGIVAVPTELKSDLAVTTLANSITLTPGTFTIFITPDKEILFVHALDMDTPEEVAGSIKSALEKPIGRVERA